MGVGKSFIINCILTLRFDEGIAHLCVYLILSRHSFSVLWTPFIFYKLYSFSLELLTRIQDMFIKHGKEEKKGLSLMLAGFK